MVRAAFAAIAEGDADRMLESYHPDVVLELPYGDPPGKRIEGKQAVRDYLAAAFQIFAMELTITEVYPTEDPDVLVLEYESTGSIRTTGVPYANRYVGIYRFRDGQVASVREYYDPRPAAIALAGGAQ